MSPEGGIALIIGVGDIGSHFAQLAQSVGMRTFGVRRHADVPAKGIEKMYGFERLETLLPLADVVAMAVPRSPQTHHLLNADRLGRLKSTAIVINAGRGDAIDPEALADALHNGRLHGAGLDVTEPEPLPAESPLWDEPHCLITPHVAGGNHLEKTSEHIIRIALTNVSRYAKQQGTVESRAILIRLCRAAGGHRLTLNTDKGRITPLLYAPYRAIRKRWLIVSTNQYWFAPIPSNFTLKPRW